MGVEIVDVDDENSRKNKQQKQFFACLNEALWLFKDKMFWILSHPQKKTKIKSKSENKHNFRIIQIPALWWDVLTHAYISMFVVSIWLCEN